MESAIVELYPNERMTPWGIERKCPKCGEWWPVDPEPEKAFYPNYRFWPRGRNTRNLYSYCTPCNCEVRRNQYHKKNPEARHYKPRD